MPTDEVGAWVELSVEPDCPCMASVDGELEELAELDPDSLLSIVDKAEKHSKGGRKKPG